MALIFVHLQLLDHLVWEAGTEERIEMACRATISDMVEEVEVIDTLEQSLVAPLEHVEAMVRFISLPPSPLCHTHIYLFFLSISFSHYLSIVLSLTFISLAYLPVRFLLRMLFSSRFVRGCGLVVCADCVSGGYV